MALTTGNVFVSLEAQRHAPALIVCPAVRGYRLAYAGGATFEVIANTATLDEAHALYRAVVQADQALAAIFIIGGH